MTSTLGSFIENSCLYLHRIFEHDVASKLTNTVSYLQALINYIPCSIQFLRIYTKIQNIMKTNQYTLCGGLEDETIICYE